MYDYHIADNLSECAEFAKELGWKGIGYVIPSANFEKEKNSVKRLKKDIKVVTGILIEGDTMNQVRRMIDKYRESVDLVFVKGGDIEMNRYIFNMPKVDVVTDVANNDRLDHVMCRLAKKHNIAIEFSFLELIQSYSKTRASIFANLNKNANLVRKFHTPFVITSGALSKWDIRSSHDLMVFGKSLGFREPEMKEAMSHSLINENKKRLSGKRIMKGVEQI